MFRGIAFRSHLSKRVVAPRAIPLARREGGTCGSDSRALTQIIHAVVIARNHRAANLVFLHVEHVARDSQRERQNSQALGVFYTDHMGAGAEPDFEGEGDSVEAAPRLFALLRMS